jgi:putative tryptophan/tyrosine transport system substrate-binding protein
MDFKRRTLIGLASVWLVQPFLATAQVATSVRRIGFLEGSSRAVVARGLEVFEQEMRNLGYTEGKNLIIEWQFANGRYENLDNLAAELVRKRVEVIVTPTTQATLAAQKATKEIPIVMFSVGDPVGNGFVASLARPGGNITGVSNLLAALGVKQLDLLRKTLPKMTRLALLVDPDSPSHALWLKPVEMAAQEAGIRTIVLDSRTLEDIERGFLKMQRERANAVMIAHAAFFYRHRDRIGALALKHKAPTMCATRDYVEAGALMSYGPNGEGTLRLAASYVDRILKGAKPGDLPVIQPTGFDLVVNVKMARSLGLAIPQEILATADKVIE